MKKSRKDKLRSRLDFPDVLIEIIDNYNETLEQIKKRILNKLNAARKYIVYSESFEYLKDLVNFNEFFENSAIRTHFQSNGSINKTIPSYRKRKFDSVGWRTYEYHDQYNKLSILISAILHFQPDHSDESTGIDTAKIFTMNIIVDELIKSGVEINAQDAEGKTALMHALSYYRIENKSTIDLLIKAGADISIRDHNGKTALIYALNNFTFGRWDVTWADNILNESIQHADTNINAKDVNGKTALMYAVQSYGRTQIIVNLIEAGADILTHDHSGQTVQDYADSMYKEILKEALKTQNKLRTKMNNYCKKQGKVLKGNEIFRAGIFKNNKEEFELTTIVNTQNDAKPR